MLGRNRQKSTTSDFDKAFAKMAKADSIAAGVAMEAVQGWIDHYPGIAQTAGESDQGATTPTRMLIEAFAAATAAREAVAAWDSAEAILNTQYEMAQEQARMGITPAWVVGFAQIRRIAIAYMLGMLKQPKMQDEFDSLFWASDLSGPRS